MGGKLNFKVRNVELQIAKIQKLARLLRKHSDDNFKLHSINSLCYEPKCNVEVYEVGTSSYYKIKEPSTELDLQGKIEKLSKLLTSLKQYSLGQIILDYKSIFRSKVPLLFKNLDDAHIANLIPALPRISFSYTPNQYPKKWDLKTYRRHYALHQIY